MKLFWLTLLSAAQAQFFCNSQFEVTSRDIIDRGEVKYSTDCEESFFKVELLPASINDDTQRIALSVQDDDGVLYAFGQEDPFSERLQFATRGPNVYFRVSEEKERFIGRGHISFSTRKSFLPQ